MSDEQVEQYLAENKFTEYRKLETGEWIGLMQLMFTLSVCMDIDYYTPYAYRWCFQDPEEARHFFKTAKEFDEVPEHKTSLKGHRYKTKPLYVEHDELGFAKW